MPPAPVDREKVSLIQQLAGTVALTGAPGSVEPNTSIHIGNGAVEATASANSDGTFSVAIAGFTGDILMLTVADTAGNQSTPEQFTVPSVVMTIEILDPFDGQQLNQDRIVVHGQTNAESSAIVIVNGKQAIRNSDGTFEVPGVEISSAAAPIVAFVSNENGESAEAGVTVQWNGYPTPLSIYPNDNLILAGAVAEFTIRYTGSAALIRADIDFDGDGSVDRSVTDLNESATYLFGSAGIYEPSVTLYANGSTYSASTRLEVGSSALIDAHLRQIWTSFLDDLSNGDIDSAKTHLSPSAQARYGAIFSILQQELPLIASGLGVISAGTITGRYAEYVVNRDVDGRSTAFLIYFIRTNSGHWKLLEL